MAEDRPGYHVPIDVAEREMDVDDKGEIGRAEDITELPEDRCTSAHADGCIYQEYVQNVFFHTLVPC